MNHTSDRLFVINYLDKSLKNIDDLEDYYLDKIINIKNILYKSRDNSRIFILGNGGSSAIASHISQDLVKMCKLDSYCLTDNTPTVTAISNDEDYSLIFKSQLKILASPGDVIILLTGGGNSKNILNTIRWAVKNNITIIALVGTDGGRLKRKYSEDITELIHIEDDMQKSEDMFLTILHIVIQMLGGKE
jgi:D-sedoheptulose 7-phosphate isomerase